MVAVRVRNPDGVSRGVRSCIVGGRGVDHLKIPLPTLGESGAETGDAESPFVVEVTLGANVP
jgi:hypothetical protein